MLSSMEMQDPGEPRLSGPRALAETLETIDLCIAGKAAHSPGVAEFLLKGT